MTAPWRTVTVAIAGATSALTAIPIAASVPVVSVAGKIVIGMTAGLGVIGCAATLGAGIWFISQIDPLDWGPQRCRSCEKQRRLIGELKTDNDELRHALVTLEVSMPSK